MADTEIVGTISSEDGQIWKLHEGLAVTGLKGNTKYKVRPVGPEFGDGVTTLAPLVAPGFSRKPQIIANASTVGVTVGGDNGEWTGNPTPTFSRVFWLKNGTDENSIIAGANGDTLSTTSGFVAGDDIYRAVEIESTINGQRQTAIEYSLPFRLTAQQSVLITAIDLKPAGQQSSVTFNVAIDGLPTITQGQQVIPVVRDGATNTWLFIAQVAGPISFFATQDGYTPLNESRTVESATPAIVDDVAKGLLRVDNVASATGITFSDPDRYDAMSGVINPAVPVGPQSVGDVVLRVQDGTAPGVGKRFIADIGPWASRYADNFGFEIEWFAGAESRTGSGNAYDAVEADAEKAIGFTVLAYDGSGIAEEIASNTLLIPAPAPLLKTTDTFTTASTTSISIDVHSGNNDADNRVYNTYGRANIAMVRSNDILYGSDYGFVSTSETVGANYKVEANAKTTYDAGTSNGIRGLRLAVGVKSLTEGFQLSYDNAAGLLRVMKGGSTVVKSHAIAIGYNSDWKPALTVHEHNDGSGNPTATLRAYVNGTEIPELSVTDPDLRGGKPGFRAEGGTANHHYFYDLTVEKLA